MILDLYIWDRWHCKSWSTGSVDIGWTDSGPWSMATTYTLDSSLESYPSSLLPTYIIDRFLNMRDTFVL